MKLYIIAGIVAVFVVVLIAVFNSLIRKRNLVKNAWGDIDVQLKRRYDLVPNLVEMVKGYAGHEKSVFEEIAALRSQAMSQTGPAGKAKAEDGLSSAIRSLFAVSEAYPELKASENFRNLQAELSKIEDDIQSARRYYNAATREFNNAIQVFPNNIVAGIFAFKPTEFFGATEEEKNPIQIKI